MDYINNIVENNNIDTTTEPKRHKISKILKKLKEQALIIMKKATSTILFSKPILFRGENGVIYPNTINTVQGASGVHKSRLVEIMISCFLSQPNKIAGFNSAEDLDVHVSYIDTERNLIEQFPYSIQQIKRLTGTPMANDLNNFMPISLIDVTREERFAALDDYFTDLRRSIDKHLIVVLDVITDCIGNFNDPKKSMELIDLMNKLINEHNLTFICVIHQNPGSDKARGHLGTELINKSSTVLQIGFDDADKELIKVTYRKCRKSKRFEPFYLVYSDQAGTLIEASADLIKEANESKKKKAPLSEVKQFLFDNLKEELPKSKLLKKLMSYFDCKSRTLEDRLKEILDHGGVIMDQNSLSMGQLEKFMDARAIYYKLTITEPEPDSDQVP